MAKNRKRSLKNYITSGYIEAANRMKPQAARRRIVAYVESYDDVFFWRTVLRAMENDKLYFEIMLPTRDKLLERGKKAAIAGLASGLGRDMIACVDADYDYLIQGATETSKEILQNPYIFHTYVYAIENYQCYAPGLHEACVMVTLNDHVTFDFERFLSEYSEIIYPLFVWNIWFYRSTNYNHFTISDFNRIIEMGSNIGPQNIGQLLGNLRLKVGRKIKQLSREHPEFEEQRQKLEAELEQLGVRQDNTYLYIQGHHLFDTIVSPLMEKICAKLIVYRQNEIRRESKHQAQMQTELSCYNHSTGDVKLMMKKNTSYMASPQFHRLQDDIHQAIQNS